MSCRRLRFEGSLKGSIPSASCRPRRFSRMESACRAGHLVRALFRTRTRTADLRFSHRTTTGPTTAHRSRPPPRSPRRPRARVLQSRSLNEVVLTPFKFSVRSVRAVRCLRAGGRVEVRLGVNDDTCSERNLPHEIGEVAACRSNGAGRGCAASLARVGAVNSDAVASAPPRRDVRLAG